MTASEGYPRIGPINTEATRPNLTAPDPTAGERCPTCGLFREEPDEPIQPGDYYTVDPTSPTRCPSCGLVPSRGSEGAARVAQARRSVSPTAVAASTGTSEDVEALARLTYEEREAIGWGLDYGTVLQEVERIITTREAAARAEERERIAQAIEALAPPAPHTVTPATVGRQATRSALMTAARIAREARP